MVPLKERANNESIESVGFVWEIEGVGLTDVGNQLPGAVW